MAINVLEVIRQGQVGGGESHLLDLIAGFDNRVNPIVLSFTGGQMIDALTQRGVKCHVVNTSHPFDVRITRQIKELILRENIQLDKPPKDIALIAATANSLLGEVDFPCLPTDSGNESQQDREE